MRKKILFLMVLLISFASFAEIDDKIELFTKDEIQRVESKLDEVAKKNNIDIYLNTSEIGNTSQLKVNEKSVIINMIRENETNLNVQISFTQDIDISLYQEEIKNILKNLEDLISEGEREKYAMEVLTTLDGIFIKVEEDKKLQKQNVSRGKWAVIIFIILGVFAFLYKNNKTRILVMEKVGLVIKKIRRNFSK